MGNTLFTNVRILDGSGGNPVPGSVLVEGKRIKAVGRGNSAIPTEPLLTLTTLTRLNRLNASVITSRRCVPPR